MHGWTGTILRIDLTSGKSWKERLSPDFLYAYLGGRGLGIRLMRDHISLDPLAPQMPLVFAAGPLCGTSAPAMDRLSIVSRSPLTGTVFDWPAGGGFAQKLKGAGFDALFITGRSNEPAVVAVTPTGAEILPATGLWGKDALETARELGSRGSAAVIGHAGEKGVLFAGIVTGGGGAVGRGGLGAVMGAKNLKGVCVAGEGGMPPADPPRFSRACEDVMRLFKASPVLYGELGIVEYGTPALVDLMRQRRMAPTENFTKTVFAASHRYSAPAIRRTYGGSTEKGVCPLCCTKVSRDGIPLPGYEALSHLGGLNGIADLSSIVETNLLCCRLGLDPVSAGATLSAWGEGRGRFPSVHEMPGLLADIAGRRGEGETLSFGSRRWAEAVGRPELSMSVKSLELPAYDPRGAYGLALAYGTSSRGGCHLRAYPVSHEIFRKPVATDRFSFSGKGRVNVMAEDAIAVVDSLAGCTFSTLAATLEEYAELLTAATGVEYSAGSLGEIGRRICLTERFYNCANGFGRNDDHLPERFYAEAGSSGEGIDIPSLDRQRYEEELSKYYRIRGLTEEGSPAESGWLHTQP